MDLNLLEALDILLAARRASQATGAAAAPVGDGGAVPGPMPLLTAPVSRTRPLYEISDRIERPYRHCGAFMGTWDGK